MAPSDDTINRVHAFYQCIGYPLTVEDKRSFEVAKIAGHIPTSDQLQPVVCSFESSLAIDPFSTGEQKCQFGLNDSSSKITFPDINTLQAYRKYHSLLGAIAEDTEITRGLSPLSNYIQNSVKKILETSFGREFKNSGSSALKEGKLRFYFSYADSSALGDANSILQLLQTKLAEKGMFFHLSEMQMESISSLSLDPSRKGIVITIPRAPTCSKELPGPSSSSSITSSSPGKNEEGDLVYVKVGKKIIPLHRSILIRATDREIVPSIELRIFDLLTLQRADTRRLFTREEAKRVVQQSMHDLLSASPANKIEYDKQQTTK